MLLAIRPDFLQPESFRQPRLERENRHSLRVGKVVFRPFDLRLFATQREMLFQWFFGSLVPPPAPLRASVLEQFAAPSRSVGFMKPLIATYFHLSFQEVVFLESERLKFQLKDAEVS